MKHWLSTALATTLLAATTALTTTALTTTALTTTALTTTALTTTALTTTALTTTALTTTASATTEGTSAVHLVPVREPALASVVLAAKGLSESVLLYDATDRDAVIATADHVGGDRHCYTSAQTPKREAQQLADLAGGLCEQVATPSDLAKKMWPDATAAVFVDRQDYRWLLRAASLALRLGTALVPIDADTREPPAWPQGTQYFMGKLGKRFAKHPDPDLVSISKDSTFLRRWLEAVGDIDSGDIDSGDTDSGDTDSGDINSVVVANPGDRDGMFSPSSLSLLAPLIGATHQAPLVLVSSRDPEKAEERVHSVLSRFGLKPSHIILVADELGLRSHRVADPVLEAGGPEARGGGTVIRVELFSELQHMRPQQFAVGRVVAENAVQASLSYARRTDRQPPRSNRPAIFLTNADDIFALGETISRTTVRELRNVGIPVRAYYRDEVTPEATRQALQQTDVLVWEGHPRDMTLGEQGGIAIEEAPEIAILQGCYTLDRSDPFILIEKGTQAIVATSAAIYSAPGSGFAKALFDSLVHDQTDLGTAVRDARNYLMALANLQRQRDHKEWRKTYRAALAFALWGDPTIKPRLEPGKPSVKPIDWNVSEAAVTLTVPRKRLRKVEVERYWARPPSRAMFGGLVLKHDDSDRREVKELYWTTIEGHSGPSHVCTAGIGWNVTSSYAPDAKTLFLLARADWEDVVASHRSGTFEFRFAADEAGCEPKESEIQAEEAEEANE